MTKNKALIKLSQEHAKLVKELIKALQFVQLSFFAASKFLFEIYSKKTYLSEDSSREITFTEFCKRPDIPLPGRSDASRLRIAQKLIRIYKFYIIEKGYKVSRLAPVGYTKLDMLVPVIKSREKEADDWLDKANLLSASDLIKEIKSKDKSLGEILECSHPNIEEVIFFKCLGCLTVWKHDPRIKK